MHSFTLILDGVTDLTPDMTDRLFEAGCADGTPWRRGQTVGIDFDREAPTLPDALSSAVQDIRRAGIGATVVRVEDVPTDPGGHVNTVNSVLQISQVLTINPELRPAVLGLLNAIPGEDLKELLEDVMQTGASARELLRELESRERLRKSRSAAG
jgi:hypothetical protein